MRGEVRDAYQLHRSRDVGRSLASVNFGVMLAQYNVPITPHETCFAAWLCHAMEIRAVSCVLHACPAHSANPHFEIYANEWSDVTIIDCRNWCTAIIERTNP